MNNTGLVSVSFRQNTPAEIASLCRANMLSYIEWGGDIHVPCGDYLKAMEAKRVSEVNGVAISSYGSYYRLGQNCDDGQSFKSVLDSACALDAPIIRVWAGNKGSLDMGKDEYNECIRDAKLICSMAQKCGKIITLECHNNTLTDDFGSTLRVLDDVNSKALKMYWQPNQFKSEQYNLESIRALSGFITVIHVFNWEKDKKYPLSEGTDIWKKYIYELENNGLSHKYLLEFMPNGTTDELQNEAKSLREILGIEEKV